ncbi:MAG: non-homologous end-joining DNA ligase [Vicinamibacteria bacterium]
MITHPEKVLFPDDGITKGELAAYHETVAPLMLPHLAGRPVTMERFPSGIGKAGFWQKDVSRGFPEWLERVEVQHKGGGSHYPVVRDARALLWLANQNCITPHVWASRLPDLMKPDLCVFDLDPSRDEPEVLRRVLLSLRVLLGELGLASWVKTTGSKGFHVVVPLDGRAPYEEVGRFSERVAARMLAREPDALTQEFAKADRGGRILFDIGRNGHGATFAAAYAVRARPGAPVSAPCTWDEVERGAIGPQSITLRTIGARVAAVGDPWADLWSRPQSLADAVGQLA